MRVVCVCACVWCVWCVYMCACVCVCICVHVCVCVCVRVVCVRVCVCTVCTYNRDHKHHMINNVPYHLLRVHSCIRVHGDNSLQFVEDVNQ